MAVTIFPETSDSVTEAAWQALNDAAAAGGAWRSSGFDLTDGTGLNVDVAAGEAYVNGYHVSSDATTTKALTASSTNYVFLEPDGTHTVNTTGTNPGNALLLGTVTTDGSSVTGISCNQNVTTGPRLYLTKASDESVTSSTTLQDDDDLTVSLSAGVWAFVFGLNVDCGAGGIKVALACTATNASVSASVHGMDDAGNGVYGFITTYGGTVTEGSAVSNRPFVVEGVASLADDGTFKLQWAQNSSNAAASSLDSGSFLFVRRVT